MRILGISILSLVLFGPGGEAAGQTSEEREALRDIAARSGDAVIRVLATRRMRHTINGQEQSQDLAVQTNATTLDRTGLVVTALSEFEAPDAVTNALRANAPAGMNISVFTETVDLRMRFADGREVPAKTVLRDADLDLMFIRPVDALPASVPAVDAPSGKPSVFDPLVVAQRLGETSSWRLLPGLSYLQIVVDKPRTLYVASTVGLNALGMGAPVFDAAGRFVGVFVRIGGSRTNPLPGILPADDLREIAGQATGK